MLTDLGIRLLLAKTGKVDRQLPHLSIGIRGHRG